MREIPNILEVAIEATEAAERRSFKLVLDRATVDNPLIELSFDSEAGQFFLRGPDERYLESFIDQVRREMPGRVNVGAPQVAYREYLAKPVDVDYTHKKQSGGSGQFGRVKVSVKPGERGSGFQFFDEIKGGNIPKEYIPSVEKGMRETAETGSLIGFPIIDFEVHLTDGAYHDVDSSALAFEICARGAMREVAQKAGIKLLEPMMRLVVLTRERWIAAVKNDLKDRAADIQGIEVDPVSRIVASAPMANLFGLEKDLKASTLGEADVAMLFDHYVEVSSDPMGPDDTFPTAAALRA